MSARSGSGSTRVLVLVLALGPALACNWLESDELVDNGPAKRDAAEFSEQVDAKLSAYSSCRDTVASVMRETWSRYSDQVDEDGVPKRRREGVYLRGIGNNSFRGCRRVLTNAAQTRPDMPTIHTSASELVEAAAAFATHTRALERALESEGGDVDFSTLNRLDPELRARHAEWAAADEAIEQAIDLRHIENDALLLGVLEGRRQPIEVDTRRLMIRARPVVRCLTREPAPAPEDCQSQIDALVGAHTRFTTTYAAGRQAADKVFWMVTFVNDVDEFSTVAQDYHRNLDHRRNRERDLRDLRDAYSSLVRDADTLDFDFP